MSLELSEPFYTENYAQAFLWPGTGPGWPSTGHWYWHKRSFYFFIARVN